MLRIRTADASLEDVFISRLAAFRPAPRVGLMEYSVQANQLTSPLPAISSPSIIVSFDMRHWARSGASWAATVPESLLPSASLCGPSWIRLRDPPRCWISTWPPSPGRSRSVSDICRSVSACGPTCRCGGKSGVLWRRLWLVGQGAARPGSTIGWVVSAWRIARTSYLQDSVVRSGFRQRLRTWPRSITASAPHAVSRRADGQRQSDIAANVLDTH